jgi:hypothetical protein
VRNIAAGFVVAFNHQHFRFQQGVASAVLHVLPYDHIGITYFVLQRDKDDSHRCARPLPHCDNTRDAGEAFIA